MDSFADIAPGWFPWLPSFLWLLAMCLWTAVCQLLFFGVTRLGKNKEATHWSDEARQNFSARLTLERGPLLCFLAAVISVLCSGIEPWVMSIRVLLVTPLTWLTCVCIAWYLGRYIKRPRLRPWPYLVATVSTWWTRMSHLGLIALCALCLAVIPRYEHYGWWPAWGVWLIAIAGQAWLLGKGRTRLGRWLGIYRPAPVAAQECLHKACVAMNYPHTALLQTEATEANAYALSAERVIVVTKPLLELLSPEALRLSFMHELQHQHQFERMGRYKVLLPMLALGACASALPLLLRAYGLWTLAIGIIFMLTLKRIMAKSRQGLEHQADVGALKDQREEKRLIYAKALESLYRFNQMPVVLHNSSHPSLYDRLLSAGYTPDYPRPQPASIKSIFWAAGLIYSLTIVMLFPAMRYLLVSGDESNARLWAMAALSPRPAEVLDELAIRKSKDNQLTVSLRLHQKAEQLAPDQARYALSTAITLAKHNRCQEAEQALKRAQKGIQAMRRKRIPSNWQETQIEIQQCWLRLRKEP